MANRERIQEVFQDHILNKTAEERRPNYQEMKKIVRSFLHSVQHTLKFIHGAMLILLQTSIESQNYWDCAKGSVAFWDCHMFLLNLYDFPYKKEHKKMKSYTGFFHTKIMRELNQADRLLELVGYKSTNTYCWTLPGKLNRKLLAELACDCFIAYEECLVMQDIYVRVGPLHYTVIQVWQCRSEFDGTEDECVEWIRLNMNRPKGRVSESTMAPPTVRAAGATATKSDNLMNTKFVVGLSQPPAQKRLFMQDSAYISRGQRSFPSGLPQGVGTTLGDLGIADDSIYDATDGFHYDSGNESEHDMYSEATQDEYIQQSLLALGQDSQRKPASSSSSPHAKEGEWDFVYNKLRDTEGDRYFEGERGDFLKKMQEREQQPSSSRHGHPTPQEINDLGRLVQETTIYNDREANSHLYGRPSALPRFPCSEQANRSFVNSYHAAPAALTVDGATSPTSPSGSRHLPVTSEVAYPPSYFTEQHPGYKDLFERENPEGISVQPLCQDNLDSKYGISDVSPSGHKRQVGISMPQERNAPLRVSLPNQLSGSSMSKQHGLPAKVQVVKPLAPKESKSLASPFDSAMKAMDESQVWQCEVCTLANQPHALVCEACGRSRSSKVTTMKIGGPDCPQCTLVNDPGSVECAACGYQLAGAPTYI